MHMTNDPPLLPTITPVIVICRTQGLGRIMAEAIVERMTNEQRNCLMTAYRQGNLPVIGQLITESHASRQEASQQDAKP